MIAAEPVKFTKFQNPVNSNLSENYFLVSYQTRRMNFIIGKN